MVFLLFPLLFIAITPNFNEPLQIFRSLFLPIWLLIFIIINPKTISKPSKIVSFFALIPLGYIVSALANKQNPFLAILGSFNRNMGILTFSSMLLILILFSGNKFRGEDFIKFGLQPLLYLSCTIGILEILSLVPFTSTTDKRIVLLTGNSNFAACYLALLILLPLYNFVNGKKSWFKGFSIVVALTIFLLGIRTESVQFYVISTVSISTFFYFYIGERSTKIGKRKTFSIGAILLSAVFVLFFKYWTTLSQAANVSDRISSWKIGVDMFLDHPIFGVGAEQFWRFQGIYKTADQQRILGNNVVVDKAHNVFIDHFANGGIVTGLPYLLFMLASIFLLRKAKKLSMVGTARLRLGLFGGIWFGYLSQLFFSPDSVFGMTLGFTSLAFVINMMSPGTTLNENRKQANHQGHILVLRSASVILLMPVVGLSFIAINSEIEIHKAATNQLLDGNEILKVFKSFPNPKGMEIVIVQALKNSENCPFTNVASDELLKVDARSSQAWYFKALCEDHNGQYVSALKFVNNALEFQPLNLVYLEAKYRLEVRSQFYADAKDTLQRIVTVDPLNSKIPELNTLLDKA
jgi:O-antigen ligase